MPNGSGIAEVEVSMQTAGLNREGLAPRENVPERHDDRFLPGENVNALDDRNVSFTVCESRNSGGH